MLQRKEGNISELGFLLQKRFPIPGSKKIRTKKKEDGLLEVLNGNMLPIYSGLITIMSTRLLKESGYVTAMTISLVTGLTSVSISSELYYS